MEFRKISRAIVFLLSFLAWIALTNLNDLQEIIAGVIVAVIVSSVAGHMVVTTEKKRAFLYRFYEGMIYIIKFIWEMIKANIHVAYIVLNPKLPINPGIVKIKTQLTKDSAITVLANSITLTPGTLTVDVNKEKGELYIHWIDVKAKDTDEATKIIGNKFEPRLMEVFE